MMENNQPFRDLDQFLTETWKLVDRFLLIECRWTHAAGYTEHVVFADFASFANYVRACPVRTNILAFTNARPTAYGVPQTEQELLALVTHRIHTDEENGSLLVEVYDPEKVYTPWLDRPGSPHSHHWITDCDDDPDNEGWIADHTGMLGNTVVFYEVAPHWSTGEFFTDIYIGNLVGAY